MSAVSDRKEAAKRLGIAIHQRYEKLVTANGENDIVVATTDLAACMYENCEFIVWALKHLGGLNPPPPERHKPNATIMPQPRAVLPQVPAIFTAGADVDMKASRRSGQDN